MIAVASLMRIARLAARLAAKTIFHRARERRRDREKKPRSIDRFIPVRARVDRGVMREKAPAGIQFRHSRAPGRPSQLWVEDIEAVKIEVPGYHCDIRLSPTPSVNERVIDFH
jgi:hypothetical protein